MKKPVLFALLAVALLLSAHPAKSQEAFSDDAFCKASNDAAQTLESGGPQWLDQVTRIDDIAVDCQGRVLAYKKFLKLKATDMQQGWQDQMQQAMNQTYCQDPQVSPAIANGWTVKVYLTLADNTSLPITITCGQ